MAVPVVDVFAGPGGLAEGFSADSTDDGHHTFSIRLSVEKDLHAHRTLELRAFVRQFARSEIPDDYYSYVSRKISREELFKRHPDAAAHAAAEAWHFELGKSKDATSEVDDRIRGALNGHRDWLLIGGPPCQAYSLVGRSRIRGESEQKYKDDHRHFLYREYLKILAHHRPAAFVMENVKGLLSTRIDKNLLVHKIIEDLQSPVEALGGTIDGPTQQKKSTYRLYGLSNDASKKEDLSAKDFVVCAEDYGIPQTRHRIIIVGVRADIEARPGALRGQQRVSIEEAIGDLPPIRSGLSQEQDSNEAWRAAIAEIADAKWLGDPGLGQSLRSELLKCANKIRRNLTRGGEFISSPAQPAVHKLWLSDDRLGGVCNHQSRIHMRSDLHRYLFAATFARVTARSPKLADFPEGLLPKHKNVREAIIGRKFNDRFRVQVRNQPATTVVSHICKDGHYFVHYDATQCRSLTVREAARLQAFPDNYVFEGPRTEQYRQVGNAVPPLLAKKIAKAILPIF